MNTSPIDAVLEALKELTEREAVTSGTGWLACCPAHEDQNPSLSVSEGNDGRVLLNCFSGCATVSVLAALGMTTRDLFPEHSGTSTADVSTGSRRTQTFSQPQEQQSEKRTRQTWPTSCEAISALEKNRGQRSAAWTYRDAEWNEVGHVLRWDRESGAEDIRPLAKTVDGWVVGAMPEPSPLYRRGEIGQSDAVFVVEGEKAADAGCSIGLNVTTSSGGSNAAAKSDWSPLAGKQVVIVPDNDQPGRKYAETVAGIVTRLDPPATVRILDLSNDWPELPNKGDLADWCDAHDSAEPEVLLKRISALVSKAAQWSSQSTIATSPHSERLRRAILQRFSEVKPESLRWLVRPSWV